MIAVPLSLLLTHFIGDFILQNDWMALGKSKTWRPLLVHCWIYSMCFMWLGLTFGLMTFSLHVLVDFYTSKIGAKLWFIDLEQPFGFNGFARAYVHPELRHWFFVWIGFDQFLHAVCLAGVYNLLFS